MKKKFLACVLLLICMSFAVNGTLAYFTGEKVAHNVITSGNIDIELEEKTAEGKDFENVDGVMPGQAVSKIVYITNTGANDAWVRIKLDKAVKLAGGGEADLKLITLDLNTENWTKEGDYYYYVGNPENKGVLAPGKSTEPLFTKVTFSGEMGNIYQNSETSLGVSAQATQVANNGDSALTAAGWPVPTT